MRENDEETSGVSDRARKEVPKCPNAAILAPTKPWSSKYKALKYAYTPKTGRCASCRPERLLLALHACFRLRCFAEHTHYNTWSQAKKQNLKQNRQVRIATCRSDINISLDIYLLTNSRKLVANKKYHNLSSDRANQSQYLILERRKR